MPILPECHMARLARSLGLLVMALGLGAPPALAADAVVLASGALRRCLGITPGQVKFTGMTAAGAASCQQLPGAALYACWYGRAASVGEPAAQRELGGYYEDGDGVAENWDLAAKLYQASAAHGWSKGQLALGRAYEFGIGVPQDRQQAIAWFARAGAQGIGQGEYFARWPRDQLNNIGFRNQAEHDLVVGGKLRFGLRSGDPTGITFRSSAQRTAWLAGPRREVDLSEAHTMWSIRSSEYQQCQRAGGSNCVNPGADPARR